MNLESTLASLRLPLQQLAEPVTGKPWQQNWLIDLIAISFSLLFLLLIWLWARTGRSKRENQVPFERTAEDFAGEIQAAYGQIPPFLLVLYAAVLIGITGYIVNAIISGVRY